LITIKNLTFTYDLQNKILDNLSLTIPTKEFSLLVGPSGCGKSTLLKILAALYPKYAGQLTGEVDLNGLRAAMLFQNASEQFTMSTPREEIIFALENLQVDREQYAQRLKLAVKFTQIDHLLDQKINTMSGGEQQRVALAVLVAMDVDLYLLDEPFASCDPDARRFLINKLAALKKQGKTILISDHLLSNYQNICDNIFQFQKKVITKLSATAKDNLLQKNKDKKNYHFALPQNEQPCFTLTNTKISENRLLLNQKHLQIMAGKTTLITGANGIGKTSLFNALSKMLPYDGSLTYYDHEISQLSTRKYLRQVGQVFQKASDQFINISVADELNLSKKSPNNHFFTDPEINKALIALELDQTLDQVVYSLSGGQQKKLQILLMIIASQAVLLLDEPLSGLDNHSAKQIINLLKENQARQGQTLVIITHDLTNIAKWCDYHLVFKNQQLTYVTK
jgi:energy-coupling factor transport system ATP-binding protein